ncbi:hypothetical protein [Candidatus Villigracilis affinis]|uniref:hypothetical protein n=1 Tax=Candidatus Villigracilis affinis TaxID=3140682 RepID=UPI002A19A5A2|nr:hypothetical protein [Anaerolineales bacterium]
MTLIKLITSADFLFQMAGFRWRIFGLTMIFLSLAGALIATPRLRWLLISLWVGYVLYGLTLPFQMYTQLLSYSTDPHHCAWIGFGAESAD